MFEEKLGNAQEVVKKAISKASNPVVVFTGENDSLITLHLVCKICNSRVPAIFIDTSVHFTEIYTFVEKIRKLWGVNLITERNEDALRTIGITENRSECCYKLKTQVLKDSIKKYNIDYLFIGNEGDGDRAEKNEDYISPKDCMRINPLARFTEEEIWEYIKQYNLPYCSLYDKGYKIIECMPCTKPVELPDEHSCSLQEQEMVKNRLRELGYF